MEANTDELWHSPNALTIDETQREVWNNQLQSLLDETIEDYNTFHRKNDSNRWKRVKQYDTFAVYSDRHRQAAAVAQADENMKTVTFMSSGFIPGKMENVLSGLFSDDTDSFRVVKSITASNLVDARVLHVFESNSMSSETVFDGIKYACHSNLGPIADRYAVFIEKIGWTRDEYNTLFSYQIRMSIDLPDFTPSTTSDAVQVDLRTVSLFRQVDNGWVGCFGTFKMYLEIRLAAKIAEVLSASRSFEFYRAIYCTYAREYSAMVAASSDTIVPESDVCEVCQKRTKMLSRLGQCSGCKRSVCKHCSHHRLLFQLSIKSMKPAKARFCIHCIETVEVNVNRIPMLSNTMQISSSSSSPRSYYRDEAFSFAASSQRPFSPTSSITSSRQSTDGDATFWGKKDFSARLLAAEWDQMHLDDWNEDEMERFNERLSRKRAVISEDELD